MRTIIITLMICFSLSLYAQDEDSQFIADLNLPQDEYSKKYIQRWNSIPELRKALTESKDHQEKLRLITRLCDFLSKDSVLDTILFTIENHTAQKGNPDVNWKLRALAIYLLGIKGKLLSETQQLKIQQMAKSHFREEHQPRVVTACAYTLVALARDNSDKVSSHRLFNKRTIAYLLSERLVQLKAQENYLCWTLTRASIRLGDSFTRFALQEVRKKPFQGKVLSTVQKGIDILSRPSAK